ncbi:Aste57867_20255 [Aphanomyces stellatus]|uniref:Aste57867_20255 protein n=1 Tax=Aphanomyces stellatus TaxID=120398 RepID=A0A485LG34_9STRA|nr:hypothetical protein As57867_020189 [Aphanomyces stellatus]VFT96945.1 Aste57867_20255 [Aphanomyces stellatus]
MESNRSVQLTGLSHDQRHDVILLELARKRAAKTTTAEAKLTSRAIRRSGNKVTQERHHAFLLEPATRIRIDAILHRVNDVLATVGLSTDFSRDDKEYVLNWMDEVDLILNAFVAGDDPRRDPLGRMVDKLAWLQHSYLCLAEAGVDAKALVGQWERDGVLDSDGSDDDDDGASSAVPVFDDMEADAEFARRERLVRRKAAARVISRTLTTTTGGSGLLANRMEEFRSFGNTFYKNIDTKVLQKESRRLGTLEDSQTKGAQSQLPGMRLKDLMRMAQHVATFKIDDALRNVEISQTKRRLREERSAVKIQLKWRSYKYAQMKLLKLIEELRKKKQAAATKKKAASVVVAVAAATEITKKLNLPSKPLTLGNQRPKGTPPSNENAIQPKTPDAPRTPPASTTALRPSKLTTPPPSKPLTPEQPLVDQNGCRPSRPLLPKPELMPSGEEVDGMIENKQDDARVTPSRARRASVVATLVTALNDETRQLEEHERLLQEMEWTAAADGGGSEWIEVVPSTSEMGVNQERSVEHDDKEARPPVARRVSTKRLSAASIAAYDYAMPKAAAVGHDDEQQQPLMQVEPQDDLQRLEHKLKSRMALKRSALVVVLANSMRAKAPAAPLGEAEPTDDVVLPTDVPPMEETDHEDDEEDDNEDEEEDDVEDQVESEEEERAAQRLAILRAAAMHRTHPATTRLCYFGGSTLQLDTTTAHVDLTKPCLPFMELESKRRPPPPSRGLEILPVDDDKDEGETRACDEAEQASRGSLLGRGEGRHDEPASSPDRSPRGRSQPVQTTSVELTDQVWISLPKLPEPVPPRTSPTRYAAFLDDLDDGGRKKKKEKRRVPGEGMLPPATTLRPHTSWATASPSYGSISRRHERDAAMHAVHILKRNEEKKSARQVQSARVGSQKRPLVVSKEEAAKGRKREAGGRSNTAQGRAGVCTIKTTSRVKSGGSGTPRREALTQETWPRTVASTDSTSTSVVFKGERRRLQDDLDDDNDEEAIDRRQLNSHRQEQQEQHCTSPLRLTADVPPDRFRTDIPQHMWTADNEEAPSSPRAISHEAARSTNAPIAAALATYIGLLYAAPSAR